MTNYIIRRLFIGFVTLLFITLIVYALIRNMPGTPLTASMAESDPSKEMSKEERARTLKIYGLDKSWPEGYVFWLGNVVQGDLGYSYYWKENVTRVILRHLGPTLMLSIPSLFFSFLLAVPLG